MARKKPKPAAPEKAVEPERKGTEKPREFNWSGLLTPNADKIYRFLLITGISALSFFALVYAREISYDTVSFAVFNARSLLFLGVCYLFSCYTAEKRISILRSALFVLVPELVIVLYILLKI